jgi:Uma2 family endonuclease
MSTTRHVTAEDLWRLEDEFHKYDVIDGVLYQLAPPSVEHGYVSLNIGSAIREHVRRHRLGQAYAESTFILADDPPTVLTPDVSFVRADRILPRDQRSAFGPQVPDLAVEIKSPSDTYPEITHKMRRYIELGVVLGWLVDPDRQTVTVFEHGKPDRVLSVADVLDGGDVLPGFQVSLASIFE